MNIKEAGAGVRKTGVRGRCREDRSQGTGVRGQGVGGKDKEVELGTLHSLNFSTNHKILKSFKI